MWVKTTLPVMQRLYDSSFRLYSVDRPKKTNVAQTHKVAKVHCSVDGATLISKAGKQLRDHCGRTGANTSVRGLDETERQRFAQKAADIRVEAGDWVIREGEDPRFFVVLEGLLQAVKDICGTTPGA